MAVKPAEKAQVNPSIAHVSDEQFEEQVLKSSEPVLVDFWAEWCGPCKMIAPILDDVATSYAGKLRVAKVNIDHNQKTPRNYNVRGIPTLMIFKDGKVQATQIGAVSKTQLTQLIDKTIGVTVPAQNSHILRLPGPATRTGCANRCCASADCAVNAGAALLCKACDKW